MAKLKIRLSPDSIQVMKAPPSFTSTDEHGSKRSRSQYEEPDERADVRAVSLGSRKQLCVYEELKSKVTDLDEACRQLLGGKHYLITAPIHEVDP